MKRNSIAPENLKLQVVKQWETDWFLLTAGENKPGKFNMMTVAWGSLGVMWAKPFVQVVVRPTRHTHNFIEQYDTFTLCAFPTECKPTLNLCGTKSGRDIDKVKESGLTPIPSTKIECPGFEESELIIECKKIYGDVFKPACFKDDSIQGNYQQNDYHSVYFGQILAVSGVQKYQC